MKIALSGNSGSGKSWVASYLVRRHDFVQTSTGNICRQISMLLFGNEDKASLNRVSEAIRRLDESIFIEAALRNVEHSRIVLDSLRYASDLPLISALGFQAWWIECPADECARRLEERGQNISNDDLMHPSETELSAELFTVIFENYGRSLRALEEEIDLLLRR